MGTFLSMEIDRKKFIIALIFTVIITAVSLYFKTFQDEMTSLEVIGESTVPGTDISKDPLTSTDTLGTSESSIDDSLEKQAQILQKMTVQNLSLDEIINELENSGLAPSVAQDKNDYTGDLVIIRLEKPLPGTRYFHGQFFKNDSGDANLQHVSFDYNGSNVEEASKKIAAAMGIQASPEVSRKDYQLYRLDNDYILWAKLLSEKDFEKLKSDPYKAYEKNDIGQIIRFALEQEIH